MRYPSESGDYARIPGVPRYTLHHIPTRADIRSARLLPVCQTCCHSWFVCLLGGMPIAQLSQFRSLLLVMRVKDVQVFSIYLTSLDPCSICVRPRAEQMRTSESSLRGGRD